MDAARRVRGGVERLRQCVTIPAVQLMSGSSNVETTPGAFLFFDPAGEETGVYTVVCPLEWQSNEERNVMLTRRGFAGCAICSAVGLIATEVAAQAPAAGIGRTLLQKTEFPGDRYVTLLMMVTIPANFTVPRHTHPGVESSFVVEGGGELSVKGQSNRMMKVGDGFQVPPVAPHAWKNGAQPTKLVITYVVEKDKPLASPAPE